MRHSICIYIHVLIFMHTQCPNNANCYELTYDKYIIKFIIYVTCKKLDIAYFFSMYIVYVYKH